jgi:Zn-dependent peptidase ImmA (M78 family)
MELELRAPPGISTVHLNVSDDKAVEVEKIVRDFGVAIIDRSLSPVIDAVGSWGNRHGPAIVVNTAGRQSGTVPGRRFTIAHELCHLLTLHIAVGRRSRLSGGS